MESCEALSERKGEPRQLIRFRVGDEEYGLDILRVKEIIQIRAITRLPRAPSFVRGIINLRGDIVPIIDLRERFGLESRTGTDAARVIVVDVEGRLLGLVVDGASQVVRLPAGQIDPPPPLIGGLSAGFVEGIGRIGDLLVILLDLERLLDADEKRAMDTLEAGIPHPGTPQGIEAAAGR